MHSIRTRLTAVTTCVIIITMVIAAALGVAAIRRIGTDTTRQMLILLCEAGQKNLNTYLEGVEQAGKSIAAYASSDLDGLDAEKLQAHVDRVQDFFDQVIYRTNGIMSYYYRIDPAVSSEVKGFWQVNPDGEGFREHEVTDITEYDTADTSSLVWFTVPKQTGSPVWLPPYITENLEERVISYSIPVYYEGQFVGVVGIELDCSFMEELVNNITLYENGYAFINDPQGNLVYHPRMDVSAMETPPEIPDGLASGDMVIRYRYEGTDKILVCLPLANGDRLNVSVPLEEINAGWKRWVAMIVVAFLVLVAVFVLFFMRYTRRITKPLQDLTKVAEQIDHGNYDSTLDYDGDDEIGSLTQTFSRVTGNLRNYISDMNYLTNQLMLQRESLYALLDNMPALCFSKDPESRTYIYCNQGFAEYADKKTPEETVGLTDYEIFDPETAKYFEEEDSKALAMDGAYRIYEDVADAMGNPRKFQTTKMKFYDSSGKMRLLGMCMDVTELERIRKESDETKAAYQEALTEKRTWLRLSALSGNLIALYYVDIQTGEYTEFSASAGDGELGFIRQGTDFFQAIHDRSLETIHPGDLPLFQSQVTGKNILATIEKDGVFVLTYRLVRDDLPTYVRLKAAKLAENGKELLIIGLMDEDVQVRQEQEYARNLSIARKMATVDSLTGVKNKHAYEQWEEKIDAQIKAGEQQPFAMVVCDINSLKAVNDLYGHKEGDACIRNACRKICSVFTHSPVFRIGGDEFVVILSGGDYDRRTELMEQISAVPADRTKIRIGETLAAGMVEFNRNRHFSLLSVFEEADKAMYERKQFLKKTCMPEEYHPAGEPDYEQMPVISSRKQLLIADDIEMNREILGDLLGDEYDILYACDGIETMEVLRSHKDEIDLVLLDLVMPNMTGREVIAKMQVDEDLMSIPVIILTVDQSAELDCLKIGAMDFLPKPYPDIDIVKARISKCIELSEDRDLIRRTERDKLTGLLNKDYFFRYVNRLDHIYKGVSLDAVACDVNRFHSVNKQYGRQFGDLVLRSIGISLRKLARKTGGIGCREGGDTFLLYCPHQEDPEWVLKDFMADVFSVKEIENKVSLRFGVYPDAQLETDVEERFIRSKSAADSVKNDAQRICGFYQT